MRPKLKSFVVVIFIALFIFLRLPSLFEPYWYGDEGIYLVLGQAIRKGLTLYTQIHDNKPPTLYYLAAIAKTVFGFRLLLFLWMVPTVYYFYKLCQKFLSPRQSLLSLLLFLIFTSIPLVEGNIANAEVFMLLPTILAFLIYNPDKPKHLFWSGMLLGFAFTFKIPVAIELSALIFFSLSTHLGSFLKKPTIKKLKTLVLPPFILLFAFFIPVAVLAIYYWYKQALSDFLFASLLQNFSYLSSWTTGSHSGNATQSGITGRAFILFVFWLFSFFTYIKGKIKTNSYLLILWFSSTIFGCLLSTRPYPHYLIQAIPPLCLLFCSIFHPAKFVSNFSKTLGLILILFLVCVCRHYNFYTYPSLSYYQAFYKNLKNPSVFQNYFGSHVNQNRQIVNHLSPQLSDDDQIFVWGDAPYLYALLDKLPAGKYTVAYHIVDFNGHSDTVINLKNYPPKFIIYYPMSNRPFDQLDDLISKYYYLDNEINSVFIYQKR